LFYDPPARHQPQPDGKILENLGFQKIRQHGSHLFFRHPDGRTATVIHKGEDLGRGITNKILHDLDVSRETLLEWLKKKKI
jgi:predicted RNA binding protein YcfA (HicA-like mRNA interferase family)